ncbi:hypothetical protein BDD39_000233 [Saccharococcus thermophilus]|uniref:Uncharacterized protein n=1 Tax=Saccharococcus thermophilus TaxID=29396 RepID=A0A846MEF0_9BACL|nr:hypothetical protein [Saccharococcus thermophilus]
MSPFLYGCKFMLVNLLIYSKKVKSTPSKYPRKPGMPNKQPIQ